jgi:hypothetical protein
MRAHVHVEQSRLVLQLSAVPNCGFADRGAVRSAGEQRCTISSAELAHQPLYRTPGHLATVSAQLRHPFRAPYTL